MPGRGLMTELRVAFARALRQWADDVIADYNVARPASAAPDATPTESRSEPDEVDEGPPAHWLAMVRARAPHLLPPGYRRTRDTEDGDDSQTVNERDVVDTRERRTPGDRQAASLDRGTPRREMPVRLEGRDAEPSADDPGVRVHKAESSTPRGDTERTRVTDAGPDDDGAARPDGAIEPYEALALTARDEELPARDAGRARDHDVAMERPRDADDPAAHAPLGEHAAARPRERLHVAFEDRAAVDERDAVVARDQAVRPPDRERAAVVAFHRTARRPERATGGLGRAAHPRRPTTAEPDRAVRSPDRAVRTPDHAPDPVTAELRRAVRVPDEGIPMLVHPGRPDRARDALVATAVREPARPATPASRARWPQLPDEPDDRAAPELWPQLPEADTAGDGEDAEADTAVRIDDPARTARLDREQQGARWNARHF
jgi:hypothetical protein